MIHIIEVNVYCRDVIDNGELNYIGSYIPNDEFKFLCDVDDKDENIYIMPHWQSMLREYFIQPFIDADGFIDKSILGKVMEVELNGRSFKYTITKHKDFYKNDEGI